MSLSFVVAFFIEEGLEKLNIFKKVIREGRPRELGLYCLGLSVIEELSLLVALKGTSEQT